MSDVEATFDRLLKLPGVMGAILVNGEGRPIRTSMDATSSHIFAEKMAPMVKMARAMVREVEPTDDLTYLRMRTLKSEILVAAENEHMIILVQDSNALDEARRNSSSSKRSS